jgi:iron complex transport system permease protein
VVLRAGGASFLVHRRAVAVAALLALGLAAACLAALCLGESAVTPDQAVRAALGLPSDAAFVVGTLRLPRLVCGLLVGAALGAAGALVQTVARNPLASPDVIGVTHGAAACAVAVLVYGLASAAALPYLAVAGGLVAAALVYVLAWRRGLSATRFVLVGVGVALALRSVTQLLLTRGDQQVAQQATVWMTGSLNGRGYAEAEPLAWALLALLPAVLWAARARRAVALDDDTAVALGVRLGRVRLGLATVGVLLAAVATGVAGPVDFVALLAPQTARRLTRGAQPPLLCSALAGALITVLADVVARLLFAPTELAVGVVTAAVGAPYLLWLIVADRSGARP